MDDYVSIRSDIHAKHLWKNFNKKNEIKVIFIIKFSRAIAQCKLQMHSINLSELLRKPSNSLKLYPVKMALSSSKLKQGSIMLVHGVEWKASNFKLTLGITKTLDPSGA